VVDEPPVEEPESGRRGPILQPALRVVAEAGWITVVYAALAVIVSKQQPILGPIEFIGFVLGGVVVARVGRRYSTVGPVLLILAFLATGAVGWLASDKAFALLPNLPKAMGVHFAGWIAAVAILRGAVINTGEHAAEEVERMLRIVPVSLAVLWAYVAIAAQPVLWLSFAVSALWGTVAFLAAAVTSIGMARLNMLHSGPVDPRQRRGWRWLVTAIGFGIVPVAVPIAVLSGIPLSAMLTPIGGPLNLVLDLIAIPLSAIVWLLSLILAPVAGPLGQFLDELQRRLAARQQFTTQTEESLLGTLLGLSMWIFTIFIVLLAIFMVARWLLRRKQPKEIELDPVAADTVRDIVVPVPELKVAPIRHRRRGAPHDAVAAYLSALVELESHEDLARQPSETPAQHAARFRRANADAGTDFARLAAGYQLARYGERRITALENVRAVGRFQRLRRVLRGSSA
jgi:MFS family permease